MGTHCATHVAETEAWAVRNALEWAWKKGVYNLEIQSDALNVVNWIEGDEALAGPIGTIVRECRNWLRKGWKVNVKHVHREQNHVVDRMAKMAVNSRTKWESIKNPPPDIRSLLLNDRLGVPSLRIISD